MTTALPTRADYFQVGAQEVFARSAKRPQGQRLTPAAAFTEGTDLNIILAAASAMADEATRHLAMRIAALFLDSAEDEDLDRLIADRFSPELFRKQAAPSLVPIRLTRSAPPSPLAVANFDIGTKFRTASGVEFKLTSPMSLAPGSTGPVYGTAEAVLSGTGGNVDTGAIAFFGSTPADSAIRVTNTEPATGGTDVETNAAFRERARAWIRTQRRGTLEAIEVGALSVPGVVSAAAEEVLDPATGRPTGQIRLYIADSNGQANVLLADAVVLALRKYRAAGVPVDVLGTRPDYQRIAYQLAFRSGIDTRAAINQLKAITVATVNLLGPNEPLLRSLLLTLARSIPGAIVTNTAVSVPGGDVFPVNGVPRSFRTRLDLVTVNGF